MLTKRGSEFEKLYQDRLSYDALNIPSTNEFLFGNEIYTTAENISNLRVTCLSAKIESV